jgi:large subunit ribosomal protein L21
MYAVIETGGKQYRVEVGTELEVELLDVAPGEALTFDRVLLVADGETAAIGRPVVANASVAATVVRRDRGEKVISFKYRPKARRRVKKGHRQELTVLRISDIVLDGHSAAADVKQAEQARARDRAKLEEAARRQAAADAELAAKLAAEKPVAPKPAVKAKAEAKSAAKAVAKPETKAAAKAEPRPDTTEKKAPARPAAKTAAKPEAKASAKSETKAAPAKSPAKRSTKKES